MSWMRDLLLFWRTSPPARDPAAARDVAEARRKLRQANREWPQAKQARDDLASWLNSAMGREQ
jgi:hypothetical protein